MSKQRIVNIYTDGSCRNNPGAGGWASVIFLSKDCEDIVTGKQIGRAHV